MSIREPVANKGGQVSDQAGSIFLKDVAQLLNVGDLDASSALYLTLESGLPVTVSLETEGERESALLYAEIGKLPTDAFLREMAQANFLGAGTDNAILALRPDQPTVCLFKRIALASCNPQDFLPVLDAFCQVATRWQLHLQTASR
ncbi:MAG: type III secretion system chaperone [Alphaproteobacteria bacterium]|nr:type III secretion system chaperone [Alphaproteobacteria bacterium]